jgi:oligopeptide transport system substrate-binding protein
MNKKSLLVLVLILSVVSFGLFAAGNQEGTGSNDYTVVYAGEITTLNYLISGSQNEHDMFANMIDSLVEYNKYGVIQPGLAESWEVSEDGLVYTMHIRKNVQWLKSDGSKYAVVKAQDWVDAAKYILNPDNASTTANVLYSVVKNGESYFNGEISDFSKVGVKALDEYTLQYTLNAPVPYFLSMLTYVTFLPMNGEFQKEMGERWGTDNNSILYNGSYLMDTFEPQSSRILVKNEKYWDADKVYIPRLYYRYNREALTLGPELFLRGEISNATNSDALPSAVAESWMNDPEKSKMIHPRKASAYTYFYGFNFNPQFEKEYEPENWKIAVNNKNFRKAMFHALDREAILSVTEPLAPRIRLSGTITPAYFSNAGGEEYTQMGNLAAFANSDSFDTAKAVEYMKKAKAELAGKVKFPVIVKMTYNSSPDKTMMVQIVEQQMEKVLGTDFIDIQIVAYPATGYLSATRRAGNYAFDLLNWGPDYADPETYTDPFTVGSNYNWPELAQGYTGADGVPVYESMVNKAKAETTDLAKRYELFAAAEAFLIDEAFVIPFSLGGGGFQANKLEPFTSSYAPFGMSELKYKGQRVLDASLSTAEYTERETLWKAERVKALNAVK